LDTRRRRFAAECKRHSFSLRDDVTEGKTLDWLDPVADRDRCSP
jgi:hypothetical protein